jgi:hypothetical protein
VTVPQEPQPVVVRLEGIEPFARFVSDVALAYGYFFALSADEIRAFPPKARRGLMALQKAVREFGESPASGPFDVRSADRPYPVLYEDSAQD